MSKIALPIAELKPALAGLGKIIGKRTTLPVLSCIKIERTTDGWTALTATDLDRWVTVRMEQPSDGDPEAILLPYDELLKISKTCPKDDTMLVWSEKTSSGASGIIEYAIGNQTAQAKVDSIPVEEFPDIPRIKGESIAVPDALRSSIHEAMECASTDETRYILNGACIDVSDPKCHYVVGTDGRHLFTSNSFRLPLAQSLIIPSHKFLGWKEFNADGDWRLKVNPTQDAEPYFQISSRRWRLISKWLEGQYPNWRQVVPKDYLTSLIFENAGQVIQTIQRMPCDDPANFRIGLEWSDKKLRLHGRSPNTEQWTKVEVPEVKGTGRDVTIFLNRQLVTKALEFGLTQADFIDGQSAMRFSNGGRSMIVMYVRRENEDSQPVPAAQLKTESIVTGEAETVNSEPAAPIAAKPERKTMPKAITATNGSAEASEKSTLELALDRVETIKGSCREAVHHLSELADTLKKLQREQKSTDKEVQSVRTTLERLQSVKL